MRVRALSALLVTLLLSGLTWAGATSKGKGFSGPVPGRYQALYKELEAKLDELDRQVSALEDTGDYQTIFSAELVTANSNRGEALLQRANLKGVMVNLDRLQELGFKGIALSINYPLLKPSFPRSAEYLRFYKLVAAEIRKRGLALIVETTTIFPDPEFSGLGVRYEGLTLEQFYREKREMAELILRELQPDYLTIDNEPSTQQRNTGLRITVDDYVKGVNFVLDGLDRSRTRIGAGGGTWDSLEVFQRLARETSLDYIDLHIYPVQGDLVYDRIFRISRLAKEHGKKLTVGESWLYKVAGNELGKTAGTESAIFIRDVYDFWAPLDIKFIDLIVKVARKTGLEFCSFFWTQFFYGYVPYNESTKDLGYNQLRNLANQEAWGNLVQGQPSSTGLYIQKLLTGAR